MHPVFDAKENLAAAFGKNLYFLKIARSCVIEDVINIFYLFLIIIK